MAFKTRSLVAVLSLCGSLAVSSFALSAEKIPVKKSLENVQGQVVSVSPTSLSVLYETSANAEHEKLVPFDEKTKLQGYRKRSEIKVGDIIELGYEKAVESEGAPTERRTMTMKSIRLVKRPAEGALVAEEGRE